MSARYSILELRTCTRNHKGHVTVGINSQFVRQFFQNENGVHEDLQFVLNRLEQSKY
jgi:hypothetical protein